ncbi:hypothetical protein DY000_02015926 [Brassica cretica]|uniref:Uncharacterized protein n=1 Tax=Brassica cretica TaxID=69181 RepID=A0ABQ7CRI3_BRACR|nr:hypothetical protein DY000_02015926 [Brassica cretica]
MDPNFKFLDTCDLDTQRLIGALAAADESRETEMGCSDGKKQQGKRVIEVADDEVNSDVEETPPPIKPTHPCKQFSLGSGSALGSGSFSTILCVGPGIVWGTLGFLFRSGARIRTRSSLGTRNVLFFVGTVLRLPRQDYYRYLFGFCILPLGSWPLSSSHAVFYFCRKSLTGLAGVGVMTQVSGLRCFPPRSVLIHVLFTLVLWGPRCALGCIGVLGSFDSMLRLAYTHSCFMSHTRYDSLWVCHCGRATFWEGWPGSEASLRQDIAPVVLRSRVPFRSEPYSEPGGGSVSPISDWGLVLLGPLILVENGKLWASDGVLETAEPRALMFSEEELYALM